MGERGHCGREKNRGHTATLLIPEKAAHGLVGLYKSQSRYKLQGYSIYRLFLFFVDRTRRALFPQIE